MGERHAPLFRMNTRILHLNSLSILFMLLFAFYLLFFMQLLLELLALLYHTLISHCLITWRVYLLNKLIGVWLRTENVMW